MSVIFAGGRAFILVGVGALGGTCPGCACGVEPGASVYADAATPEGEHWHHKCVIAHIEQRMSRATESNE